MNIKLVKKYIPLIYSKETLPLFLRIAEAKKICEVGVHKGKFFDKLISIDPEEYVGVDIWDDYDPSLYFYALHRGYNKAGLKKAYRNLVRVSAKYNGRVRFIKRLSVEACHLFEDEYFDFIYLDADHSYEGVKKDLEAWWPKVKYGGILAGHDYMKDYIDKEGQKYGVYRAVNEFVKDKKLEDCFYVINQKKCPSFMILKE